MTVYRKDIDGIRAIAVLSVIFFHLGFLQNGYLGVDIFFVISGYLITKIAYSETLNRNFSIKYFYLRRIRRIIPLVLFCSLISLIIGILVMLPDDLENLSQSVVATNFFSNNILLLITTGNYWDLVNEFKPLMHTWSLGVEEQFYILFPMIFLIFSGKKIRYIMPTLLILSILSLYMYLFQGNDASKFYLIQYRFFELSTGAISAIVLGDRRFKVVFKFVFLMLLIILLGINFQINDSLRLILVVALSITILITEDKNFIDKYILENKVMIYFGKISFSLYMWHQIVFAYARYFVLEKIDLLSSFFLFLIVLLLSILSFNFIEQPFRKKDLISNKNLIFVTSIVFLITTFMSLFIYFNGGVLKDVPELNIRLKDVKNHSSLFNYKNENVHIIYNSRIYDLDKSFTKDKSLKVLVIGNSFARDWVNILLETNVIDEKQISYISEIDKYADLKERTEAADIIFFSELRYRDFINLSHIYSIDANKVYNIGTKNFGSNNGIFYNKKRNDEYCFQRTKLDDGFIKRNNLLKKEWGNKFIDLINVNIDKNKTVPVFTENCRFISQDCRHLTKDGAVYYSKELRNRIKFILRKL